MRPADLAAVDLRCICTFTHDCGRCHNRATQEDRLCDSCRGPAAQTEHTLHYIVTAYGGRR